MVTVNNFEQNTMVNVIDNRGKILMSFTTTDFVYADSLNTSPVFFLLTKFVVENAFHLNPTQVFFSTDLLNRGSLDPFVNSGFISLGVTPFPINECQSTRLSPST